MSRIGFIVLTGLIMYVVSTQLIVPLIMGEPLFPIFGNKRKESEQDAKPEVTKDDVAVDIEAEINRVQKLIEQEELRVEHGVNAAREEVKKYRLELINLMKQKERIK